MRSKHAALKAVANHRLSAVLTTWPRRSSRPGPQRLEEGRLYMLLTKPQQRFLRALLKTWWDENPCEVRGRFLVIGQEMYAMYLAEPLIDPAVLYIDEHPWGGLFLDYTDGQMLK